MQPLIFSRLMTSVPQLNGWTTSFFFDSLSNQLSPWTLILFSPSTSPQSSILQYLWEYHGTHSPKKATTSKASSAMSVSNGTSLRDLSLFLQQSVFESFLKSQPFYLFPILVSTKRPSLQYIVPSNMSRLSTLKVAVTYPPSHNFCPNSQMTMFFITSMPLAYIS